MESLIKLPYKYDELEPHIDARTMEIHHTKHHQKYVDTYNEAVKGTQFDSMPVHEVLSKLSQVPEDIRKVVQNHGGGVSNHNLFFSTMGPETGDKGLVYDKLKQKFGSFEDEFTKAALTQFGSGWAFLVVNNGELEIVKKLNQDSPLTDKMVPILCVDVWEHAYYLKYQNKRADYVKAWWNVINWDKVNELYNEARK